MRKYSVFYKSLPVGLSKKGENKVYNKLLCHSFFKRLSFYAQFNTNTRNKIMIALSTLQGHFSGFFMGEMFHNGLAGASHIGLVGRSAHRSCREIRTLVLQGPHTSVL